MSKWGLYVVTVIPCAGEAKEHQHVAPCDDDGNMLAPHIPFETCPCRPVLDAECCLPQWVHNDRERSAH